MGPGSDDAALARALERLLSDQPAGAGIRTHVLASWQRCRSLGLVADHPMELPFSDDLESASSLAEAARPVLAKLESRLSGTRVSVLLSDGRARLVDRRVGEPCLNRELDALQLAPGFAVSEDHIGTNGIGTALATRRPAFILGREHFTDSWSSLACAGAPIRDPLSGQVIGVLDVSCPSDHADPSLMTAAREAARSIEQELLGQATSREQALLRSFHEARRRSVTGTPDGTDMPAWQLLDRHDQRVLEESANALISSGRAGLLDVELGHGQTAVLLSHPVRTPSGVVGFAVEAVLPQGVLHRISPTTADPPAGWGPPASRPRPFLLPRTACPGDALPAMPAPRAEPPSRAPDRWLLAVGEPGISRLALRARQRLCLLYDAVGRVGTTLDVARTAEELTEVVVPGFADFAAVDLPEAVLLGEEPIRVGDGLHRAAVTGIRRGSRLYAVGDVLDYAASSPQARSLAEGESVLEPELSKAVGWIAHDPAHARDVLDAGVRSLITVPLRARGTVLGVVSLYRSRPGEPFEEDDLSLAEELVGRAALAIDNARRFTREHALALALQRSLLPRGLPAQHAVSAAHCYLPARSGVGGDWFDVIPLSGARVALVVGDVVGHGLHAAATMGRLRTAVQNFSALDLAVDEVLTQLDDLVGGLDMDQEEAEAGQEIGGASCLYAVYDPTTRRCTLACAGHPPLALVRPDGTVEYPDLPVGPPLGVGGQPFETAEIDVPEGSMLVLYTDGLIEHLGHQDVDLGMERLRRELARPGRTPEQSCQALRALLPDHPPDDVALLVARTRALDARQVATWELRADPATVSRVRADVTAQLAEWSLEHLAFTTELVVSELVTNAVRYGGEPIVLRLLRDCALICEVSDGSSTSPHLRRALTTDEGGRGLFLVAQLAQRWGTRYTPNGKVIWAEQPLTPL